MCSLTIESVRCLYCEWHNSSKTKMPLIDDTLVFILFELCFLLELDYNWQPLRNIKTSIHPLVIQAHNEFQQNTEESKNLHHPETALEMKPCLLLEQNVIHIKRKVLNVFTADEVLFRLILFFLCLWNVNSKTSKLLSKAQKMFSLKGRGWMEWSVD